jgi:orotidine-5'-phosphate decarboxylase
MAKPVEAASTVMSVKERVIVALDVDSADEARRIVDELAGQSGAFKIGLQLFTAAGPDIVREFTSAGHKIFLDLKFHDIPNTVAKAAVEAARLGVWMFNVHASGGGEMMRHAVTALNDVCENEDLKRPLLIAVTVLTSSNADTLSETGIDAEPNDQVIRLALLTADSGLDGVVASPLETEMIRAAIPREDFVIVTPGIRGTNATADDQKRVTTLGQAIAAGSSYVVIGRPITGAADRKQAFEQLVAEAENS